MTHDISSKVINLYPFLSQNINLKCRIVGNLLEVMKSSPKAIVDLTKGGYSLIITLFYKI